MNTGTGHITVLYASLVGIVLPLLFMTSANCGKLSSSVSLADPPSSPLKYTSLGDSITHGEGTTAPCNTTTPVLIPTQCIGSTSWADRLSQTLAKSSPISFQNLGISGAQVDTVINRELPLIQPDVDLITLYEGTNDLAHLTATYLEDPVKFEIEYADLKAKYEAIIAHLQKQFAKARIVVLNVPNIGFLPYYKARWKSTERAKMISSRVNRKIIDPYFAKGVTVVDLTCDPNSYNPDYLADGLHPNDQGAHILANKVFEMMKAPSSPKRECQYFPKLWSRFFK